MTMACRYHYNIFPALFADHYPPREQNKGMINNQRPGPYYSLVPSPWSLASAPLPPYIP